MFQAYRYSDLTSREHFRLLTLTGSEDNIVTGMLESFHIDQCPAFTALSYCWGLPATAVEFQLRLADKYVLSIQENLFKALRNFVTQGLRQPFWVDAVCINQSNDAEKGYQIPLMRRIYADASTVIAWLGDATAIEKAVFSEIPGVIQNMVRPEAASIAPKLFSDDIAHTLHVPDTRSEFWPVFGRIINRPWFSRLWILQELLLAREITVYCGGASLEWANLLELQRIILQWGLANLLQGTDYTIEEVFRALNVISNFHWCTKKMGLSYDRAVPISGLIHVTRRKQVTNPLDSIYGILGLVSDYVRSSTVVDYQSSFSNACINFLGHCLLSDYRLELFSQISGSQEKNNSELPSWCPDIRQVAPINQFGGINGLPSGYHAGFSRHSQQDISNTPVPLPLNQASTAVLRDREDECLQKTLQSCNTTEEAILSAFTRTLVANRNLEKGTNLYIMLTGDTIGLYKSHRRRLDRHVKQGGTTRGTTDPASYPVLDARTDRAFIITKGKRLGYTRPGVQVGDLVCVFENSIVPFVLRRNCEPETFHLVGEAYVDGLINAIKLPKYQELNRKINRERNRQRHALLQDIKKRWEYDQPVYDVEQQLAGGEIKEDLEVVDAALPPAQKELVDAILAHPGLSIEEEIRRRNKAIHAVVRYCEIL
ncbi:HET-domain-containing protein [Delitschia confertaspora ATCC 74209]|uniref:HET-domain-containing protein n=1 Tax=Delitschia confertaspora ATCC 74209 TaxID=1513339 RepID=A0A9P4JP10_9PLEO|nr:HET-domain-containing protein [Delitschia confertaspora ATCC 74209]